MNAKVLHPKHETNALSENHHIAVPYACNVCEMSNS